jgi:alcohol dehydrogenase class IV
VLPEVIIYDVDLTLSLPAQMTITSGINAMAHAVEALYSTDSNPITDMLAEQGIARLASALPILSKDPQNTEARSDALFGAWACGSCLGVVSMALHHKLCHALGMHLFLCLFLY